MRDTAHAATADTAVNTARTFSDFCLLPEVEAAIRGLGFETPTPIQTAIFDKVMAGDDLIAMAQTGTGKTAAFGIPMAQKLAPDKKAIQALVLTPTRELALQVCKELSAIGAKRGLFPAAVYGGASFTKQVSEVTAGAQVVVGTPGRVLDHIRRRTISFAALEMLVLDEADEMLSMGFEKEISEIIESLPKKRQTLLFSATIPPDIRRLTQRYMGEAEVVSVSGDEVGAKEVSHFFYLVSGKDRPRDLVKVLEAETPDSAIVFCNTREETQTVARYLKNAGYNADWINSDLSQVERERVMHQTRSGELKFLVATDVAARGIDISLLSHVINYSFPEALEIYVHRTGRTGRMGQLGIAVSLITPQDIGNLYYLRLTYKIFPIEKHLPDTAIAAQTEEIERIERLRAEIAGNDHTALLGLARRLLADVHRERILAGLLARHFEAVATSRAAQEASPPPPAAAAAHREPAPAALEPIREPVAETIIRDADHVKPPAEEDELSEERGSTGGEGDREIYLDAGRKDGLRISALMKEIVRVTGLPRTAVGKVRMLTRATFISVPEQHFEAVLQVLGKLEVDGRTLKAEPARQS